MIIHPGNRFRDAALIVELVSENKITEMNYLLNDDSEVEYDNKMEENDG